MKNVEVIVCRFDCCRGLMAGRLWYWKTDSTHYTTTLHPMLTRHRNYGMPFVDVPGDYGCSLGYRRKCKLSADSLMRWDPTAMRVSGTVMQMDGWYQYVSPFHRSSVSRKSISYRSKWSSLIAIDCFWFICVESSAINLRVFAFIHIEPPHLVRQTTKWFCSSFSVFEWFFSLFLFISFFRRSLTHWPKWTVYCIHIVRNYHYHFTFTVWWPTSLKR